MRYVRAVSCLGFARPLRFGRNLSMMRPRKQLESHRISHLLKNISLSDDGKNIVDAQTKQLSHQIAEAYDLSEAGRNRVCKMLDKGLWMYKDVLLKQLQQARASFGHLHGHRSKKDEEFREMQGMVRKTQKLLAKSHFAPRGQALDDTQRAFLREVPDRLRAISQSMFRQATRDCAEAPEAPSELASRIPTYLPLYDQGHIEALLDALCIVLGLELQARPSLYMLLARQMVVFASVDHPEEDVPHNGLLSAFDLSTELQNGAGFLVVKRVFEPEAMQRVAAHIERLHEVQQQGVRHFAGGEIIPSKRIWDLLQHDTPERDFANQLKHPVLVAINAVTLGSEWRVGSLAVNETVPGSSAQEPHIDYPKWRKHGHNYIEFARAEGGPGECQTLQGCVAYEPFTREAGATGIVPGSQHWEVYPHSAKQVEEYKRNEVVAEMEVGDYLVFNPNCQHRGRANSTDDRTRKAGVFQFVAGHVQPMEVPGPMVQNCITKPSSFDDHFLRAVHTFPYPDDLAGKAGLETNAEGTAQRSSGDSFIGAAPITVEPDATDSKGDNGENSLRYQTILSQLNTQIKSEKGQHPKRGPRTCKRCRDNGGAHFRICRGKTPGPKTSKSTCEYFDATGNAR